MAGQDLSNARLEGFWRANFAGANLVGADLTGAILTDADFTNGMLTDADCPRRFRWQWATVAGGPQR